MRMKSGVCAGGRSAGGRTSGGRTAGHEVRESGERPSSAPTSRVGMWVGWGGWQSRGVWAREGEANDLMGLLPKSAVMVSQRPPLWRSRRERRSCSALLGRSCLRPNMEGQLPAMCPLLVNWPHSGQRRVGLWVSRRVLWTPHMNSCLCVN